jgi:ribosomal protein L22
MSTPGDPTERPEDLTAPEVGAAGREPEGDAPEAAPEAEAPPEGDAPEADVAPEAEAAPEGDAPEAEAAPEADVADATPEPAEAEPEATAAAVTGVEKEAAREARRAAPAQTPRPRRGRPGAADGRAVVRAQAKYVRTSARKARLVCDGIRGKSVQEARAILAFSPRAVARDWAKLLESAVANAEHNHELVGDDLQVLAVTADEGPTLKRFRPRAMGRATRIRKRTSHLTITLTPKGQS